MLFSIDKSIDTVIIYDETAFVGIRGSDCSALENNIYSNIVTYDTLQDTFFSAMETPIVERIENLASSTYSFPATYNVVRWIFLIIGRLKLKDA